ncbi:Na/Pi cotransporter family protein [Algisphaera agarilytica]|uniref:Phosphate:Na+ symporter n=1 Tax=Algisphaera agarilytica TaxID=1385975 RepID=A0A7X0H824_9BACT|nr:Na/Pi cotransporter family protein [Algisphaera agarilytica]MBB6431015.1 phosphate:Na+ symporter [Algisphaera agarilytica]
MVLLLNIAGGVALILFGVRFLRKGLDRLLGDRLGPVMQRFARSRIKAFLAGIGVAVIAPSSTTMSVLAVQTVRDGHLPPRRVLAVILGADIGLTMMVLLIALRLDQYAAGFVAIGVALFQFTRSSRSRGIGQVVLSLGFIFLGIMTISSAASSVQPDGDLLELLTLAARYPFLLAAIAAVLAIALQSSTASIGLAMGLAAADLGELNPMSFAVPVVIGANVGVGVTLLIIAGSQPAARRLALGNLICKLTTAVMLLALSAWVIRFVDGLPLNLDRKIAVSHSGFNLVMAACFLPLVNPVYYLVNRIAPDPPEAQQREFGPRFLNNRHIDGLAIATGQSRQEIMRVSAMVRGMLDDLWQALQKRDPELAQSVQERDDQVDLLDREIKRYLARIAGEDADADTSAEVMAQLRYTNELETIGDIIDRNLAELVVKRAETDIWFSDDGWAELDSFYKKVAENLLIAETAFATRDQILAQRLLRHKQALGEEERQLRDSHFTRLRQGQTQSHESSSVHLDILTHLRRINSCVTHVAYAIVQSQAEPA